MLNRAFIGRLGALSLSMAGCVLLAAGGVMLTGCKKTQINELEPVGLSTSQKLDEPRTILVVPYAVNNENVKLDSGPLKRILRRTTIIDATEEEKELVHKLTHNLAQGMVDQFKKAGYDAKVVAAESDATAGNLVVDGTLTQVDAGNTARRTAIGFGAGKAMVRAVTRVVYMEGKTPVQVMTFSSDGETMKKPGAVTTMGGSAVVTGASAAAGAASEETANNAESVAHKSGRDLADEILASFPKLGWPASKPVVK